MTAGDSGTGREGPSRSYTPPVVTSGPIEVSHGSTSSPTAACHRYRMPGSWWAPTACWSKAERRGPQRSEDTRRKAGRSPALDFSRDRIGS
jgi:hypothetical protein